MRKIWFIKHTIWIVLALAMMATAISPAQAAHRGTQSPVVATAPILQNADINIGNLTRRFQSAVLLNSVDRTTATPHPVTFAGVDLWAGGTPAASYTTTFVSGRASTDFTTAGVDAPVATAQTPFPSSTGEGNLTTGSSYVFNVTAKDAGGHLSNTVTLTIHITNPTGSGCLTIGNNSTVGSAPAGFGLSSGYCILIATGTDKETSRVIYNFGNSWTSPVVIQNADLTKQAAFSNLQIDKTSFVTLQHFTMSGNINAAHPNGAMYSFFTSGGSYSHVLFDDDHNYYSPTNGPNFGWWSDGFCTAACGVTNSDVDYIGTGIGLSDPNAILTNVTVRHFYNNATVGSGCCGTHLEEVALIAPNVQDSLHTDVAQIEDGGSLDGLSAHHLWALEAGGDDQAQSYYFGGSVLRTNCYISSGAGVSTPGNVLTCTGGFNTQSSNSHIFAPGVTGAAISDNIIMTCDSAHQSNCGGQTTATVNVTASIGTPASPVLFYSVNGLNFNAVGVVSTNATPHGMANVGSHGTWLLDHFAYIEHYAQPFYAPTFLGTFSGTSPNQILTITTQPVGNIPGEPVFVGSGQRLSYPLCSYCGPGINSQLTGTPSGTGTYAVGGTVLNQGPVTMSASSSYPQGAAEGVSGSCDTPALNDGTQTWSNGYLMGGHLTSIFGSGTPCGSNPANVVLTHVLTGAGTLTGADFVSGVLPTTALESHPNSFYNAMTIAQLKAFHCNAMLPKVGGQLDGGGGVWYWPFTATGEWADDGTPVPGCGIH